MLRNAYLYVRKIKIAIIGTHGTGKTSLAHSLVGELKERGLNAGFINEIVRECPLPVGTHDRNSVPGQVWVLCRQLMQELEGVHKYDIIVSDRSVIDNYAYLLWNLRNGRDADETLKKVALDIFNTWSQTYDHVIKLPVSPKLSADGFRDTDEQWRVDIDRIISELLDSNEIRYSEVRLAPNRSRVEEVLKLLNIAPPVAESA